MVAGEKELPVGYARAAGSRHQRVREDTGEIAEYFNVPVDRLTRALERVETADNPAVVLLQNPNPEARVCAISLFSSVWSNAYKRVGNPYGKIHRDYHYQCIFQSLGVLVEVGCTRISIDSPMPGYLWRKDAYICAMEAFRNIQKNICQDTFLAVTDDSCNPKLIQMLNRNQRKFDMQEHRPIGVHPHLFEGLNMRTIFVEDAQTAKRKSGFSLQI